MNVIAPDLLKSFHTPGVCELCGRVCRAREPHHVLGRGMGRGRRIDHPWNLLCVGTVWECSCHSRAQGYKISQSAQWAIIDKREGLMPGTAEREIRRIRALHPSEA